MYIERERYSTRDLCFKSAHRAARPQGVRPAKCLGGNERATAIIITTTTTTELLILLL